MFRLRTTLLHLIAVLIFSNSLRDVHTQQEEQRTADDESQKIPLKYINPNMAIPIVYVIRRVPDMQGNNKIPQNDKNPQAREEASLHISYYIPNNIIRDRDGEKVMDQTTLRSKRSPSYGGGGQGCSQCGGGGGGHHGGGGHGAGGGGYPQHGGGGGTSGSWSTSSSSSSSGSWGSGGGYGKRK